MQWGEWKHTCFLSRRPSLRIETWCLDFLLPLLDDILVGRRYEGEASEVNLRTRNRTFSSRLTPPWHYLPDSCPYTRWPLLTEFTTLQKRSWIEGRMSPWGVYKLLQKVVCANWCTLWNYLNRGCHFKFLMSWDVANMTDVSVHGTANAEDATVYCSKCLHEDIYISMRTYI